MEQTPFMQGFRQICEGGANLSPRPLTPRVREAYAALDLLRFEGLRDSVEEPEVAPPQELVQLLMGFLAQPPQTTAAAS
jgi:hypothetical protein